MPRLFVSAVIPAKPDDVWNLVRDFNGLPLWLPLVSESRILGDKYADQIGSTRELLLQNGDRITETLVAMSDYDMTFSYTMGDTPMALSNYFATMRLSPVTESNQTFVEWSAEFDCAPEDEDGLVDGIAGGVFETGLQALSRRFEG